MVALWIYVAFMIFLIDLRLYLKQPHGSSILLIVIRHFGYTFAFLLRWSGINLCCSLLGLWNMVIVLNIELGWLFHSIVLDLISLCRKSLQFLYLSRALIVFNSNMMTELPTRMCLLNAFPTKDHLTSHAKFIFLWVFKASLALLYRLDFFPISFGLCIILVAWITEGDRIMVELLLALGVVSRSIASLACEFETASIAHEIAHLLARRAFMLFLLVFFGSLEQAAFFFKVGRIFWLLMGIHIRTY